MVAGFVRSDAVVDPGYRGGVAVTEPVINQPHVGTSVGMISAEDTLNQIRDSLRGLRFGSVNIIVQDGVIIQIDRTEKRRLRGNRNHS
jgi:hypothetical protein